MRLVASAMNGNADSSVSCAKRGLLLRVMLRRPTRYRMREQLRPQTRLWREQPGATIAVRGRLTSLASNHVRFTDCRLSEEGD